jgi:hypothetical protein
LAVLTIIPGVFYRVLRKSVEDATIFKEFSVFPENSPTYETALNAGVIAA